MVNQVENFDATNIAPQQMGDKHPVGTFPFRITNTYGTPNKNTPGGQFVVEMTSPVGAVLNRYNLWNSEPKAVEIAQKELSALCHCVGIFKLSFKDIPPEQYGRELRGGEGTMKVGLQDESKPDGYVEVKKVFDRGGNEPGKGSAQSQTTQQQPANNAQNNNGGGWGNQATQQPQPQQQGGGWAPPAAGAAPTNQGGGNAAPPWAKN